MVTAFKRFCKNRDFWGDVPFYFLTGGTRPPSPPPVSAPMAAKTCQPPHENITSPLELINSHNSLRRKNLVGLKMCDVIPITP